MQRFRFSLETLLALRQAKLEEQEQQLGVAVSAYNKEQQKLRNNRNASTQAWASLHENGVPVLEPDSHAAEYSSKNHSVYLYLDRLEQQSQQIDEKMHQARSAMEEQQNRYAEMRKDMRVLEKLRERQFHQYQQKLERKQDEASAEMFQAKVSLLGSHGLFSIAKGKG